MSADVVAVMGNFRSNRYAAIVDDGIVSKIWQEEAIPQVTVSGADNVLQHL
jgi:peroxiredoxin